MITADQMNRLLAILGCTHRTAAIGEPIASYIDHILDHLEGRVTPPHRDG